MVETNDMQTHAEMTVVAEQAEEEFLSWDAVSNEDQTLRSSQARLHACVPVLTFAAPAEPSLTVPPGQDSHAAPAACIWLISHGLSSIITLLASEASRCTSSITEAA